MKTSITMSMLCLTIAFATFTASAQTATAAKTKNEKSMKNMKTYVIEREIPNAGNLTAEELQGISQKSCSVLKELGPDIEWVQSYVTDNKIFCIYKAENEEILRTHAMKGGFPINSVHLLSTTISPATATAALAEIK
ncbi:MAG TPA: DUF4242 domain-containing protein [Chryseolinea sp.]|nr:DUF4242 domain-containing protein [Chryseolinea sp.]